MHKKHWLNEQIDEASKDIKNWPSWMRREAGFKETSEKSSQGYERTQKEGSRAGGKSDKR